MNTFGTILGMINIAQRLFNLAQDLKKAAQQSGELTPDQEVELDQKMTEAFGSDAWKPRD